MAYEMGDYVSTIYRTDIIWQITDVREPSKRFLASDNGRRTTGQRLRLICIGTTPGRSSIHGRGNRTTMSESEVLPANPMLVLAMEANR